MERKRFETCPHCNGEGHETVRVWAFDGAVKCWLCKGFGLVSLAEFAQYHLDSILSN